MPLGRLIPVSLVVGIFAGLLSRDKIVRSVVTSVLVGAALWVLLLWIFGSFETFGREFTFGSFGFIWTFGLVCIVPIVIVAVALSVLWRVASGLRARVDRTT